MKENNKFVIISSYDDHVRYFNNIIDGKEYRCPIFTKQRLNHSYHKIIISKNYII